MIYLLDGGMGQELVHRSSSDKSDNLWSARTLLDEYDLVKDLHKDFIMAGAQGIIINSYAITPHRLKLYNMQDQFNSLQTKACTAAIEARQETQKQVDIFGSLPPLVASYHKTVGVARQDAVDVYRRMVDIQLKYVDGFICETVCSIEEAEIVTDVALESGKKVWLSYTVNDQDGTYLRGGEQLEFGVEHFEQSNVDAVLINCSYPEAIEQSMQVCKNFNKPFGGYPNGFDSVEPLLPGGDVSVLNKRKDFNKDVFVDSVIKYIDHGATIIGGCCEVGPEYISAVNEALKQKNLV